ncbi:MAG: hypothetical protein KIT83_21255 [Bryobacterales bacterium]|nr:hypothetical protein [Bryobacterales bacterium]
MATAANWQQEEASFQETARTGWRESTDKYRLRPVPNEDVYFYSKRVDNTRLVRPVNHAARRREVRVMASGFAMLLLVVGLTLPHLLNVMAGAQIQKLRAEHERLLAVHAELTFRESELMNPERLKAIARSRNMVELAPDRVHQMEPQPKTETVEAKLKP